MQLNLIFSTCSMVELGEVTCWDLQKTKEKFETELEVLIKDITTKTTSRLRPKIIMYNCDDDEEYAFFTDKGFKVIHHYDGWIPKKYPRGVDIMIREVTPLKPGDKPEENKPVENIGEQTPEVVTLTVNQ